MKLKKKISFLEFSCMSYTTLFVKINAFSNFAGLVLERLALVLAIMLRFSNSL